MINRIWWQCQTGSQTDVKDSANMDLYQLLTLCDIKDTVSKATIRILHYIMYRLYV